MGCTLPRESADDRALLSSPHIGIAVFGAISKLNLGQYLTTFGPANDNAMGQERHT